MNVNVGFNFGSFVKSYCPSGHFLSVANGRNAMCDVCRRCGLNPSYACVQCNFDLCEGCAHNQGFQRKQDYYSNISYKTQQVPAAQVIKLYETNHQTHMFVGNSQDGGDHTVYACKKSGFNPQNFDPRTGFVILPTNNGYFQIMDTDHNAFLFVGNSVDNGGDHTVYACPQKLWKDYNDFMKRTSFTFVQAENGTWRIVDADHNAYLFVGNGNDGGDHTMYAVPVNKFNGNQNEWARRTTWVVEGAKPLAPTNRTIKAYDTNHSTFMFVGNSAQDGDHTVYACKQTGFQSQNFHPRTSMVILPTTDGYYQIMDTDHQAFLFVGNGIDNGGDHTVYACPQKLWKDYNDFMNRTSFQLVPAEDNCWRILDKKHDSYLFIGNSNDGGDHTVYSVPVNKFNQNQNEWARRTLFYLS
jgi:hypothetical protein